jgi:hypothetical protein
MSSDLPANSRKLSGFTTAAHNLVLVHISQLHLKVPELRSMSASKRTVLQWQPPEYVLFI